MREYVNPFQTYKAFWKDRWQTRYGRDHSKAQQTLADFTEPDPIVLPPLK